MVVVSRRVKVLQPNQRDVPRMRMRMTISSVRERHQNRTLKRKSVRPLANLRKSFGGFSSEDGARVTAVYLTFIETCRLMKRASLDFFKGFFGMTSGGRTDYELITQELLC